MNNSIKYEISGLNGWIFDNPPTVASFEFERVDIEYWNEFVNNYSHYSFYIGALYVIVLFTLQRWMRNRQAFELKYPLFLWNVLLAVFSVFGFARASPPLFWVLTEKNGFYKSVCVKKGLNLPNVLWGLLFVASKIWELGDTVFIVLRKKPLVFLQWYHHLATLLVTWAVAPLMEPIGRWYGCLNFGVHSIMYSYFALKTVDVRVPSIISRGITLFQFAQMIMGLIVNLASFYFKRTGYDCARDRASIIAFSLVYGSFALLFGKLIWDSFNKNWINKQHNLTKND